MTLHTPVVLTDEAGVAAAARARKWPVVHPEEATLRLTGVAQTAPLPEPRMDIPAGSLLPPHAAGWTFVLDWIEKHVHAPMLVAAPGSWAADLAQWAAVSRGWPVRLPRDLTDLPPSPMLDFDRPSAPTPSVRTPGVTRVLLVAHDSDSTRVTTWLQAAEESDGLVVDLATTTVTGLTDRVHVVPDLGPATLAPGRGALEPVPAVVFQRAADQAFDPTREEAGHWQVALERWFGARDDHFDVVVITGPPVAHFGFAAWAQRVWYARTVLDHGLPFALHPGEGSTTEVRELQAYWERGWSMAADVVTVPTDAAHRLVVPSGPGGRVETVLDDDPSGATTLLRELGDHSFAPGG